MRSGQQKEDIWRSSGWTERLRRGIRTDRERHLGADRINRQTDKQLRRLNHEQGNHRTCTGHHYCSSEKERKIRKVCMEIIGVIQKKLSGWQCSNRAAGFAGRINRMGKYGRDRQDHFRQVSSKRNKRALAAACRQTEVQNNKEEITEMLPLSANICEQHYKNTHILKKLQKYSRRTDCGGVNWKVI